MGTESNLYLIGMMGSGKTSVGQALAQRLKRPFIDADREIAHLAGKPLSQIFATEGEALFRHHEGRVIRALSARKNVVAALNSGALGREMNRLRLGVSGRLIWLDFPVNVLLSRLDQDGDTPLLTGLDPAAKQQSLMGLLEARRSHYAMADHILRFDRDLPVEDVVCRVVDCLNSSSH